MNKIIKVILELNNLRDYQEYTFSNNTNINEIYTLRFIFIPTICWFPGCIPLAFIIGIPIAIVGALLSILYVVLFIGYLVFTSLFDTSCFCESSFIAC